MINLLLIKLIRIIDTPDREYRKVCVNFKLLMILNINIKNLFMFLTKININDVFKFVKV